MFGLGKRPQKTNGPVRLVGPGRFRFMVTVLGEGNLRGIAEILSAAKKIEDGDIGHHRFRRASDGYAAL